MCEHIADAADQGQLVTWFQYVLSLNQPTTINVNIILSYTYILLNVDKFSLLDQSQV